MRSQSREADVCALDSRRLRWSSTRRLAHCSPHDDARKAHSGTPDSPGRGCRAGSLQLHRQRTGRAERICSCREGACASRLHRPARRPARQHSWSSRLHCLWSRHYRAARIPNQYELSRLPRSELGWYRGELKQRTFCWRSEAVSSDAEEAPVLSPCNPVPQQLPERSRRDSHIRRSSIMRALSSTLTSVVPPTAARGRSTARAAASCANPARSVQRKAHARPSRSLVVRAAIAEPPGRGAMSDVAHQSETRKKRLQTQTQEIAKGVTTIRSLDWCAKGCLSKPRQRPQTTPPKD